MNSSIKITFLCFGLVWLVASSSFAQSAALPSGPVRSNSALILTPPAPLVPRINGARVYGERPGRPFLFTVPVTGARPMIYGAKGLPNGLTLNPHNGHITGSVAKAGNYLVTLTAKNVLGSVKQQLLIRIGPALCLTPPMGWNTYDSLGDSVDQAQVETQARAMASSGLAEHGYTYISIDDAWQGKRTGPDHAMESNSNYPDMQGMCRMIHALGLKAGLYSTPWMTSYAGNPGETSDNPQGDWAPPTTRPHYNGTTPPWSIGPYHFEAQDARQYAQWGFDYLKYDWYPNGVPETAEMADALKGSGRDFIFSLSNTAPFSKAVDWTQLANLWRTTGDIRDSWRSLLANGFSQDKWAPYAGPGHWNDPDDLVVGVTGGWAHGGPSRPTARDLRPTHLTPDEQYTQVSLWSLLAAPLILGCDLTKLDPFTLSLITNDEVIAVDQDPLGQEARLIQQSTQDGTEIWARPLADGTEAVGLFNIGNSKTNPNSAPVLIHVTWAQLHLRSPQPVRDLWREKNMGLKMNGFAAIVPFHGVELIKIGVPKKNWLSKLK